MLERVAAQNTREARSSLVERDHRPPAAQRGPQRVDEVREQRHAGLPRTTRERQDRRADEAYLLGPGPANQSYLVIDKLIEVAGQAGAEAIHPGYGFLAENAGFARACEEAGIVFIGPPADAIDAMGSKTRARELMKDAGIPIIPGTTDPVPTVDEARKIIDDSVGYPVAIKTAGDGGGTGFSVALDGDEIGGP